MKCRKILILLCVVLSIYSYGQENYFRGRIINAKTKKGIGFATVEIFRKSTGCAANETGEFYLDTNNIDKNDTVIFSALGYQKKEVIFTKLDKSIELLPIAFEIPEVVVNSEVKIIYKGNLTKKPKMRWYIRKFGDEIQYHIPSNIEKKIEYIECVYVYIAEQKGNYEQLKDYGLLNRPFRVRFYEVDTVSGSHEKGNDLVFDNIIFYPKLEKEGWCEIDVSKYNIHIPDNGIIVAIEMINYSSMNKEDGMFIGFSKKRKMETSNTRIHRIGHKYSFVEENHNAMIYLKVRLL